MSRTDSASPIIAAPQGRIYAALVDETALTEWLPPAGMTGRATHVHGLATAPVEWATRVTSFLDRALGVNG